MTTGPTREEDRYASPRDPAADRESVLDALIEGVVYQDAEGRVTYHNPAAARILGCPVAEAFLAANLQVSDGCSSSSGAEHPSLVARRTGVPCTGVILGIPRGATTAWISVNSVPLFRPGETKPYAVVSTVADVTAEYQDHLKVRADERVFRLLVENQNEGIGVVDLEERFLVTNHAGDEIFGVPRGGLAGRSLRDFLTDEGRRLVSEQTRTRLLGQRSQYDLEIVRASDGAPRIIRLSAAPHIDDEGRVTGTVGVFSDVTDRIQVERALQENEARLRLTFDQAPIGAAVVGMDRRYVQVNAAFCRMLGYEEHELLGKSVLEITHPDHAPVTAQSIQRIMDGFTSQYETEKRYLRKDGGVVWAHLTVTLLRTPSDQKPYLLTMVEDISERKAAETENARLQAQVLQAQKMESIGRLAGGVAHDFNNLLTVINGYSAMALDMLSAGDPLRSRIAEISRAGERAAALVRQLLAFSRKQVLKQDFIDVNGMIADMEQMLRPLVGEDVEMVTVLRPGLGKVLADRHQMEQVIMNLAVNARDAMPHGGRLFIDTGRTVWGNACPNCGAEVRPGPYVRTSVRDTGTGMADEVRQHVFEPFFTTKSVGRGTGLGLATVHGIVLQSGGHIDVETRPGEGTTFHVYLPSVDSAREPSVSPAPSTPARGSGTILLVEDQAEVRRFTATLLRECGYDVVEAADGEEAVAYSAKLRMDLLITDVVMPKMSGIDLAARIRAAQPAVRVLFMSGYSDEVLAWPADARKNAAFIQKPFGLDAMASKVREVLGEAVGASAASLHQPDLE